MKQMIALLALLTAGTLFADSTPIMVSLVTPVQAPSRDYDVTGFRLDLLYGECRDFAGLDIGVVNRAAGDFTGIGIGGVNIANGTFLGGQVGLVNWSGNTKEAWEERSFGAQIGILNYAGSFCGLQDGIVNVSTQTFAGLESGFVNCANDVRGVQCGDWFIIGVNVASGTVNGCQIGLVNYAETMECGLQIGMVNIIARNGWLPCLPIVNGHF